MKVNNDLIRADNFIRLTEQIILLFSHKSTHLLVKEKICMGISKVITIPVVNKDLKYMNSKLLAEFRCQILKHPNKYWSLFKTFVEDLKSRLINTKSKTDDKNQDFPDQKRFNLFIPSKEALLNAGDHDVQMFDPDELFR
jgi:hypothetical protein